MTITESDRRFSQKAVELEFITQKQLDRVLQLKEKMPDKKIGEILMAKGFISIREVKIILKELGEKDGLEVSQFDTYFWSLKIRCSCGKKIMFPGNLIGNKGMCPQCLKKIVIPSYESPEVLGFGCSCGTKLPENATTCPNCNGIRPDLKNKPRVANATQSKIAVAPPTKIPHSLSSKRSPSKPPTKPEVLTPEPVLLTPETPEVLTPDPIHSSREPATFLTPLTPEPLVPEVLTPDPYASASFLKKQSLSAHLEKTNVFQDKKVSKLPVSQVETKIIQAQQQLALSESDSSGELPAEVLNRASKSDVLQAVDVSEQAADRQFARICFRMGLATQNQIENAFEEQERSYQQTKNYLKLGQILIRSGVLSVQDFLKIVGEQKKNVVECEKCHMSYRIKTYKPNARMTCKQCGAEIFLPATLAPTMGNQTAHAELGTVVPSSATLTSSQTAEVKTAAFKETGLVGKKLGKYEVLEELGRGGMGVVFKAKDSVLNRIVAMKILRDGDIASEEQIRRFQKEAESMGKIRHPLIVPIFDYGQVEDLHYFTMEHIHGKTLDDHLERRAFSQAKCVKILHEIADAIHAAHSAGIIHRDLKPSNVMMDEDGHPHIMDFGLAKDIDLKSKLTRTGAQVGTPYYMSPEQARGEKKITPSVDIYALGVILYEMLTGRVPFTGQNQAEVYHKIINKKPRSIREINPKVSADLEVIVNRLLMKYPEDRYATAQDLAEDLERFMEHMPIQAKRDTAVSRMFRFFRHHQKQSLMLVGVSAVFLGLIYLLVSVLSKHQDTNLKISELQKKLDAQLHEDPQKKVEVDLKRQEEIRKNIDEIIMELRNISTKPDRQLQFRLVQLNDEDEIDYLATFLKDPEIRIRELVASTFIRVGKSHAGPYILDALKRAEDTEEIATYLSAIGLLKYQPGIPVVFQFFNHPRKKIRDIAISSISMLEAERQYIPILLETLKTARDTRLKSLVIHVLMTNYSFPEVYPALIECLSDTSVMIQDLSIQAVGRLKLKDAIPKLGQIARFNPNPTLRRYAVDALGKIGDERAIEILKETLKDDSFYVVTKAAQALQLLSLGKPDYDFYKQIEQEVEEKISLQKSYIAQANNARKNRNFTAALEFIEKALKISPSFEVYFQRGLTYYRMRDFDQALRDYRQAERLNSFDKEVMFALSELYMVQGKQHHALEEISKALEINPRDEEGLKRRAMLYQEMGLYDKAIEDLKILLVIIENEAQGYNYLAEAYVIAKDYPNALENYALALKTDPESHQVYESRAGFFLSQAKYEKALEDIEHAIKINPRSVRALSCRGEIYRRQKKFKQSLESFLMGLAIDPKDTECAMIAGELLEEEGKIEEAIRYYTQAIDVGLPEAIFYIKRGAAYIGLKQYEQAIPDYEEAFQLNPTLTQSHHGLVYCYIELNRLDKALELARRAEECGVRLPPQFLKQIREKEQKK